MTRNIYPTLEIPTLPGGPPAPAPDIPITPPVPAPDVPAPSPDLPEVPDVPVPSTPPDAPPDLPPEPTGPRRDPDPMPTPEPPVLPPAPDAPRPDPGAPDEAPDLPPAPDGPRRPAALSRRAFLHSAALSLFGGALAACGAPGDRTGLEVSGTVLRLPDPVLPSPEPPGAQAAPAPGGPLALDGFLALSALLTGFGGLNPTTGAVYLESLRANPELGPGLEALYEQAGFAGGAGAQTVQDLEARGALEDETARAAADRLIEMWYSGVYDTPDGGQAVATYADALVWRAVPYTKPLTICGVPGFWSEAPELVLD